MIRTIRKPCAAVGVKQQWWSLLFLRQHIDGLVGHLRTCLMTTNTDKNHLVPLWKQWQLYSLGTKVHFREFALPIRAAEVRRLPDPIRGSLELWAPDPLTVGPVAVRSGTPVRTLVTRILNRFPFPE